MKIILMEDVTKLGKAGEVVSVKDGYARNFLIPQKLAVPASNKNMAQVNHAKSLVTVHRRKVAAESAELLEAIAAVKLEVAKRAGEEDKLYGSVTAAEIADLLLAEGIKIDRRLIDIREPIKTLGEHVVHVRLKEVEPAQLIIQVVPEKN